MDAAEQEERELIELAIACARSGDATHWPTAAGWLLVEIEHLRRTVGALEAELRRRPATDASVLAELRAAFEQAREDEEARGFTIRVVDPVTANLINRAKATHELMLREQEETDRHNEAIRPFVDARARELAKRDAERSVHPRLDAALEQLAKREALGFNPDYRADPLNPDSVVARFGLAEQRLREVRPEVEHGIRVVLRGDGDYVRLVCLCGWWAGLDSGSAAAVENTLSMHKAHPESFAAELATDVGRGLALGTTHARNLAAVEEDQQGEATTGTVTPEQDTDHG